MTGHNQPVDSPNGSPEDVINSTDQDCRPRALPGLPVCPILFVLFVIETEASKGSHHNMHHVPILLVHPSCCPTYHLQREKNSTCVSALLQSEDSGESKRKDSSFIHLEMKNSTAKPTLGSCSTWKANQTSWVCKTEWKNCKKTNFACGIFTSFLWPWLEK